MILPFPVLLILHTIDGAIQNAVTVVDDLIFDSQYHPNKTKKTLLWDLRSSRAQPKGLSFETTHSSRTSREFRGDDDPPSRFPHSNANQAVLPSHNTIVPEECIYVVIDLETTGLSCKLNNIIELAAEILSYDGVPIEDGSYSSLIRPPSTIPAVVSEFTGITQEMVMDKPRFSEVIVEFFKFIEDRIKDLDDARPTKIHDTIFVGHNAV